MQTLLNLDDQRIIELHKEIYGFNNSEVGSLPILHLYKFLSQFNLGFLTYFGSDSYSSHNIEWALYCILSKLNPENGRKLFSNIQEFMMGYNDTPITITETITSLSKLEQRLMSIDVEMKNNSATLMIINVGRC